MRPDYVSPCLIDSYSARGDCPTRGDDGDPRDVLLQAQESYTAGPRNRMSVHALEDCVMEFEVTEVTD